MNEDKLKAELDFLRWYYHMNRIGSGNSQEFEKHLSEVYSRERGGWFPYFIAEEKK